MRIAAVGLVVLTCLVVPGSALAAICINAGADVLVLSIAGQSSDGYFSLVGEDIGICGAGTSGPLAGTAHFRADGSVHFAVNAMHATVDDCGPVAYEGSLNPPFFNSGSGGYVNAFGRQLIPFTPAATCSTVDGLPEKTRGSDGNGLARP